MRKIDSTRESPYRIFNLTVTLPCCSQPRHSLASLFRLYVGPIFELRSAPTVRRGLLTNNGRYLPSRAAFCTHPAFIHQYRLDRSIYSGARFSLSLAVVTHRSVPALWIGKCEVRRVRHARMHARNIPPTEHLTVETVHAPAGRGGAPRRKNRVYQARRSRAKQGTAEAERHAKMFPVGLVDRRGMIEKPLAKYRTQRCYDRK